MRDLHPDFATKIQEREVSPALMVFLDLDGMPLRAWTGLGTIQYAGEDWLGFGMLGNVEPVEEYSDIRAGQVVLTLTRIPNESLSDLGDLVFKRRAAEIYLALFVGDSRELVGVELLMRGTMDTLTLSRSPDGSTIKLRLANELAKLRESWGTLYTDPYQQAIYPGDTALRFVQSMQDITISI